MVETVSTAIQLPGKFDFRCDAQRSVLVSVNGMRTEGNVAETVLRAP